MGAQCRCRCHPWTAELYRKQANPNPAERRGGYKRKGKARDAAIVIPQPAAKPARPTRAPRAALPPKPPAPDFFNQDPVDDEPAETDLHNTCPKCLTRAKATDQFCRKDGTKLCLGKPCPRCEAPANEPDEFCWQCGWKLADPMPQSTAVDPIPMRGREMPQLNGKEVQFAPVEMPPAPQATLSLPPGAAELLSERHSPGTVAVSQPDTIDTAAALPSDETPVEDAILRLRRLAREQGLLPPEVVVT